MRRLVLLHFSTVNLQQFKHNAQNISMECILTCYDGLDMNVFGVMEVVRIYNVLY